MTVELNFEMKGPFRGGLTEEGRNFLQALANRFGTQKEVAMPELFAYIKEEYPDIDPVLGVLFYGGVDMMTTGLGFELQYKPDDPNKVIAPITDWKFVKPNE